MTTTSSDNDARSYLRLAIKTEIGKTTIRELYPNDATTLIGTAGDAYDDEAVIEVAEALKGRICQSYGL